MPMSTLDKVLNWAVPVGIILLFAGIFYSKMKEPIDNVLRWIKNAFSSSKDKLAEQGQKVQVVYKYG